VRILVVAPQPFYEERGTPIAVRLLVETLCDFGHDVDLLVYQQGQDIEFPRLRIVRAGRPPGIQNVPIGFSWQKLVSDLWLAATMIRLLFTRRYDVVHAVEEAVFLAAVFNLLSRRRLVYDMDSWMSQQLTDKWRALQPLRPLLVGIERLAVRRATVVLPVCEDLAQVVRGWVDPQRVVLLPDVPMGDAEPGGVQESLRAIAGPEALIALYVGNLERYQGIDLMLDGLAQLPRDTPLQTIVIGGSAADIETYRARAAQLGLGDRVHFLGPRPVAQLNAYLAQADLLLSPRTLGQNTPMKVYSYMQSGKAMLATAIRSHTQVLDGECAELVAAEPAAWAAGLARLAGNAEHRRRLGAAARTKAESEYSLPAFRARLQQAYVKVAAD
jgi:glycosyltransferase involved in cell wall biosynthesis